MRTQRGTFAPGNPGGPGRPPKAIEERYQDAVKAAVSPSGLAAVFRALLAKAKDGDVPAARLLSEYCLGRPGEMKSPSEDTDPVTIRVVYDEPPASGAMPPGATVSAPRSYNVPETAGENRS